MGVSTGFGAVVLGRAGADLYPIQARTKAGGRADAPAVRGGFAVNVATGLARLAWRGGDLGAIVATRLSCSVTMPRSEEIDALLAAGCVEDGVVKAPPPVPSTS
jgi:hypothetical protein